MSTFNRKGIREAVFNQMDWAPSQSRVAKDRVNQFMDRAYMQLVQDAPFLFFEEETRWAVHEDQVPSLSTDLLTTTTDAWVLETKLAVGTTDALVWETDREWGGRALLLKVPGTDPEQWELIRIREVWTEATKIRIGLERPWRNVTDDDITFRVVSDEFTFPDDMVELKMASIFEDNTAYIRPLEVIGQSVAEYVAYPHNNASQVGGPPVSLYRREYQAIQAPVDTPTTGTVDGTWTGPEPTGEFDYVFTYCWGKQEMWSHAPGPETQTALTPASERYEPYWESPPCPVPKSVVNSSGAGANKPIQITLPNIDFMLGFGDASTPRYGHSGFYKRIYRRRISSSLASVESPYTFFLLDEVDGLTTAYTDNGSITPDYMRPLREVHGYQTFRLYPKPNRRYQLVLRYIRRPRPMTDDADTPRVVRDAVEPLIMRTAAFTYLHQGNAAMANTMMQQYEDALHDLKKRYGDLRQSNRPHQRNYASTRRWYRRRRDTAGLVKNV